MLENVSKVFPFKFREILQTVNFGLAMFISSEGVKKVLRLFH